MDRLQALASLRLGAKREAIHDDDGEPIYIGVCRDLGKGFCNYDEPSECEHCYRFWHDDPRTDQEILAAIDRKH